MGSRAVRTSFVAAWLLLLASCSLGAIPDPPKDLVDWPMPFVGDFPAVAADALLDKPAAKNGPIVIRDGHFFTGPNRIRFWGVNFAFSANFPPHTDADAVAARLAHLGINAVRLHHMDNQVFPNGIFADAKLEMLSPEALDRLDYLIAALAKQGIYCDLNLHVSRGWTTSHHLPGADKLPDRSDKTIDIFDPDLIAANKQYARDLLGHVNAYTNHRYADEPSICFVEINNEDTLFMWGGEGNLSRLPEPYAGRLNVLWNDWLAKKYATREKLKAAWAVGEMSLGAEMLKWTLDAPHQPRDYAAIGKEWVVEQDGQGTMTAAGVGMPNDAQGIQLTVDKVDGTDWHLQFHQPGLKVEKGKFYTLKFSAQAAKPGELSVGVSMAHAPWENLGIGTRFSVKPPLATFSYGFTASASDDNARLSFVVGQAVNTITLTGISLSEGGREGLGNEETFGPRKKLQTKPMTPVASHRLGASETAARSADWFDFLQQTDEHYFVDMRDFLKNELHVKQPITGTIGLGALSTASQSHMDFVDAHAYWDHPNFPHRQWDMNDWEMKNTAMVDEPEHAVLWDLAGTRVAGKPFTVTEYAHPSPNDWSAEGVPMIASFAALQDWDAVFLFAYSHDANYAKDHTSGFFDIESNPTKLPFLPLAARIFLGQDTDGAITPLPRNEATKVSRQSTLDHASTYYHEMWPFIRDVYGLAWPQLLQSQFSITFNGGISALKPTTAERARWTSEGEKTGTGRYTVADDHGVVFVGFRPGQPLDVGDLRIERLDTPFASMILTPADSSQSIATADRLLLAVVARSENTGMVHTPDRKSIGNHWGKAPSRIEVVKGELSLPGGRYEFFPVKSDGTRGEAIATTTANGRTQFPLGGAVTVWYEIDRKK